jgi:hypothetical protein
VFIIFAWAITACYFEESRSSILLPYDQYNIDTGTILESISRGEKNIFTPIETPSVPVEFQPVPVDWGQSDYLAIANSLHEFVWNESLDSWSLNAVNFSSMDCNRISYGFQNVRFIFFKEVKNANNDDGYRIEHAMYIELYEKSVGVTASKYSPLVMAWTEIDLTKIKVPSDKAFEIAEYNGGSEIRKSMNNNCSVSISLNSGASSNKNWLVSYYSEGGSPSFNIEIDSVTGEYK